MAARDRVLDMPTLNAVRNVCREYNMSLAAYYEASNMGAGTEGAVSYQYLLNTMSGGRISEAQHDTITASLLYVRSSLKHRGVTPVGKDVARLLKRVLAMHADDPGHVTRSEWTQLRKLLNNIVSRHDGT